jgi:hypothetical protein
MVLSVVGFGGGWEWVIWPWEEDSVKISDWRRAKQRGAGQRSPSIVLNLAESDFLSAAPPKSTHCAKMRQKHNWETENRSQIGHPFAVDDIQL